MRVIDDSKELHAKEFVVFILVFSFVEGSLTRTEGLLGFRV